MTDEKILELSYKNPTHFSELFNRYNKHFLTIARKTLRSEDDAEDVVQETFVKMYKYGKKLPLKGGQFKPWANTILKNCMADRINKYKNAALPLTEEIENTTPDLRITDNSEKNYMEFVFRKIDQASAEILNLRYMLGKSFKQIAKMLDIKSSTARVRVYRAKKIFEETYKQFNLYGE